MKALIDRAGCKAKIPAKFLSANAKHIAPETSGVLEHLRTSSYMANRGFQAV